MMCNSADNITLNLTEEQINLVTLCILEHNLEDQDKLINAIQEHPSLVTVEQFNDLASVVYEEMQKAVKKIDYFFECKAHREVLYAIKDAKNLSDLLYHIIITSYF